MLAAFTEICEEDSCWIDQYLTEIERLQVPFGMHFDRCSDATKQRFIHHPLFLESVSQDDPRVEYTERHKQEIFDKLMGLGMTWLLQWNIDEIFEKDAGPKFADVLRNPNEALRVKWVNCWGDLGHIRIDTVFANSLRFKFYRVGGNRAWIFDNPTVHGCKLLSAKHPGRGRRAPEERTDEADTDIVCLHTGLMTRDLRLLHKQRWDRIYRRAIGRNPYGFWDYCLDERAHPPTIIENPYL